MKASIFTIFFTFIFIQINIQAQSFSFIKEQLTYSRVQKANSEKMAQLKQDLQATNSSNQIKNIYIRAFKQESALEVWIENKQTKQYELFKSYPICLISGVLGPKRQSGDRQIPEGFYHLDYFNPKSSFYLSMRMNYPNIFDLVNGARHYLGGDIFIHGGCETIGCIPITNDKIKELYLIAAMAFENDQSQIPVHVFPYRFDKGSPDIALNQFTDLDLEKLNPFWNNIAQVYYYFEEKKELPFVHIEQDGQVSVY